MTTNYKIFSGEIEIVISGKVKSLTEESKKTFQPSSLEEIHQIAEMIKKKPTLHKIEIQSNKPQEIFRKFKKQFVYIRAAGGIVKNKKGETLFIFKNDNWDLPKGKISPMEKKKDAAIREVSEECGIKKLQITHSRGKTYHIGHINKSFFLKKTYWYEMFCEDDENISPQAEENITRIKWVDLKQNQSILKHIYGNLKELLKKEV